MGADSQVEGLAEMTEEEIDAELQALIGQDEDLEKPQEAEAPSEDVQRDGVALPRSTNDDAAVASLPAEPISEPPAKADPQKSAGQAEEKDLALKLETPPAADPAPTEIKAAHKPQLGKKRQLAVAPAKLVAAALPPVPKEPLPSAPEAVSTETSQPEGLQKDSPAGSSPAKNVSADDPPSAKAGAPAEETAEKPVAAKSSSLPAKAAPAAKDTAPVKKAVAAKAPAPVKKVSPGSTDASAKSNSLPAKAAPAAKDTPPVKKPAAVKAPAPVKKEVSKLADAEKAQKKRGRPKADADAGVAKAKRGKTGYQFFCAEHRKSVKDEAPELKSTEVLVKLAEMWAATTEEERKKFQDMAAADKVACAEAAKAAGTPVQKKRKAEDAPKAPRAKSAYMLFCADRRASVKDECPELGPPQVMQKLAELWKAAGAEDRMKFEEMAAAEKLSLKAAAGNIPAAPRKAKKKEQAASARKETSDDDEDDEEKEAISEPEDDRTGEADAEADATAANSDKSADGEAEAAETTTQKDSPKLSKKARASARRAARQEADEESDDEEDRMNCDWKTHPAEFLIGETASSKYVVKRKGLDYTEYGLVDARAAKRQRLGPAAPDAPPCPVTLAMVEDYENSVKTFKRTFHHCTDEKGVLALEDLEANSALEMCSFLGSMMLPDYPLAKPMKDLKDRWIRVPMLGVSMLVQRLVSQERQLRVMAEEKSAAGRHKVAPEE